GTEHILSAGLALSLGDCPERIETAGDGGEEPLFAFDIGCAWAEERRLCLIGAMCPTETLNRVVGAPARFEQIMDTKPLILGLQIGVIGSSCAAGVGKGQHALVVIHAGTGFCKVCRTGTSLDGKPSVLSADDPAGAPGDCGNALFPGMPYDLVKRPMDGRQGAQVLDHGVASLDCFAALNGVAFGIESGP